MKTHPYYNGLQKAIKAFLIHHDLYEPHAKKNDIEISFYETDDIWVHQDPKKLVALSKTESKEHKGTEWSGIQIEFPAPKHMESPKAYTALYQLIQRAQHHDFPPEYFPEGYIRHDDYSDFDKVISYGTCWHRCSITWKTYSDAISYKLQVGYCHCS